MTTPGTHSIPVRWLTITLVLFSLLGVNSVAIAQQGSIQEAKTLNQRVARLYAEGRYQEAISLAEQAVTIWEKVLGPNHPDTATSLNNLAALYQATGAYAQAEPLYLRALGISEKVLGPDHPDTATSLNNLAALYQATGAYAQAEPLYLRALAISEKVLGADHSETAQALNSLALLYEATGAYAQAEPLYLRALAISEKVLGADHSDTAQALNNLAALYQTTGAYVQAEPLYLRALAISEKVLGPDHPTTAISLNNLAALYQTTGAHAQAESLYLWALAIRAKVLGPDHPTTATTLNNLAGLYHATGAYAQAEPLYRRALAIYEKGLGPDHPTTAGSLSDLASLRWATGDAVASLSLYERVQAIEEKNTRGFLLSSSETRKQSYLQQLHGDTFTHITFSLSQSNRRSTELGFTNVLQIKGRVLESMSESMARLRRSVKPEDRTLFEQLAAVGQQRSALIHQGPGHQSADVHRGQLVALASKQDELETELSKRSAEFRQEVVPITLSAVQMALTKDAALIEYYRYRPFDPKARDRKNSWGKPRYVAYVLPHEGDAAVLDLGESEPLERLIQDFRDALSDPHNSFVREIAQELSEKLIGPLCPHLRNIKRFLLSPDGALNLVPFAALVDETGTYLGTRFELVYLTSGRDLLRFGTSTVTKNATVIVADPNYGQPVTAVAQTEPSLQPFRSVDLDRGGMTFQPLTGTAKEAQALRKLLQLSDKQILTQENATETRFKQLEGPQILHIATHGFFLKDHELPVAALSLVSFSDTRPVTPVGENPLLRSGLALAGANARRSGEKDDGILTAAEVAQMDLRRTQLVVLSACETGIGDIHNGEGVYGLRRALVLAGAETQVTSLWKVSDDATKDLMVDYYKRLLKGEGRSEALRNAQLTMMKSKDRSHPYYWAAFVPIGDWRPLANGK